MQFLIFVPDEKTPEAAIQAGAVTTPVGAHVGTSLLYGGGVAFMSSAMKAPAGSKRFVLEEKCKNV